MPAESEGRDGAAPNTCVHCTGGCGRKVHAECARRLSLAGGSAADDTSACRGRGARPAAAPAALPPLPAPVPPDPPAPPAAALGSQGGKHKLDGGYWSAAPPAGKRSAAARSAAAEACVEAAARGASAGPKRGRGPATAKVEVKAEVEADLEAAMASAAGPWAAMASADTGGGGWAAAAAGAAAVAAEALAVEAAGWRCGRCAALLGRAVYARGVDGFYHRGVAVARDEHGQMQVEMPLLVRGRP